VQTQIVQKAIIHQEVLTASKRTVDLYMSIQIQTHLRLHFPGDTLVWSEEMRFFIQKLLHNRTQFGKINVVSPGKSWMLSKIGVVQRLNKVASNLFP